MNNYASGKASPPFIFLTLFLAFALEFLPWPEVLLRVKPLFPLLALVYWAIHKPRLINYSAAVVLGVMMDLANQTTLGFNVISCSVVVLMTNMLGGRFVLLGGFGQTVHIFAILAAGQLSLLSLEWILGEFSFSFRWQLLYPSMTAAAMWSVLPFLMHSLRNLVSGSGRGHGDY